MANRFGGNDDYQMEIKEKINTALRIVLGVCFVLSGTMKAVNVYSFAQEIRLYIEAYMNTILLPWTVEIAVVICAIETTIGLLALKKIFPMLVSIAFFLMMSFFVWLTGINYFYPSLMGRIESCGCFGELIHFSPIASFIKSAVLWMMATVLLGHYLKTGRKMSLNTFLKDNETYYLSIAGILPALYSYICFENIEHSLYLAGYIVLLIIVVTILIFCYVVRK